MGWISILPSIVPEEDEVSVNLIDLVSLAWRVKTSFDKVIFAYLSANKGVSLTSTLFSPSLVIFQLASIMLPIFAKPIFKKGSNCNFATWG